MLNVRVHCAPWWILASVLPRYTLAGIDVTQDQDEALPNPRVRFPGGGKRQIPVDSFA
jgi:hypothetical protein